jgi:photosystem II stability/assembly factor-like uncharacterized protein
VVILAKSIINNHSQATLVFRTLDGGEQWTLLVDTNSEANWHGMYYGNNGLWYTNLKNVLFSSRDLGLTWDTATVDPVKIEPQPDDAFYSRYSGYRITHVGLEQSLIEWVGDSNGLWIKQQDIQGYMNEVSAPSERVAYAVGPNGLLYKTTDGGGRFASVASIDDKPTTLKAWSSGSTIIVENASGDIRVLDLLGRVVRSGNGEKLDGFAPGVYFVVSGEESVRVLVSPL